MYLGHPVVDHVGPALEQVVQHPADVFFVAWDGAAGDDDGVAAAHTHVAVGTVGHPVEGRTRLALGAGRKNHQLFLRYAGVDVYQQAAWHVEVTQLLGQFKVRAQAATGEGHLTSVLLCQIDDLLQPGEQAGEGSDDDPVPLRLGEQPVQRIAHHPLRFRPPGLVGIGAVCQHCQHAVFCQLAQPGQIRGPASGRGLVQFIIAGVYHAADGRADHESHRIRDGVGHRIGVEAEGTQVNRILFLDHLHICEVHQVLFFQPARRNAQGQRRAVNGHRADRLQRLQQERQTEDVVHVPVRKHDATQHIPVFHDVVKVG